jgi:hypothetical protein
LAHREEMKNDFERMTKRNIAISELLEKIRSQKSTPESKARDDALQAEFDQNQLLMSELMMQLFRNEET